MTPTTAELLRGIAASLAVPPAAEDMAQFVAGRLGVVALVSLLAAQEAERGAAVRIAENAELRAFLADAEAAYPSTVDAPADPGDGDLTITALDTANAVLRHRLIALHVAIEAAADVARDRAVLAIYQRMAAARRLVLPSAGRPGDVDAPA